MPAHSQGKEAGLDVGAPKWGHLGALVGYLVDKIRVRLRPSRERSRLGE